MKKNIKDELLRGAVAEVIEDDDFKGQLRNTLFQLPNAAITGLGWSVDNGLISVNVDYEFKPSVADFDSFTNGYETVSLNSLKYFFEKNCNSLISGRVFMFHFILFNAVGSYDVLFPYLDSSSAISDLLTNVMDFDVVIDFDVVVDYSDVFEIDIVKDNGLMS